MSTRLVHVEPGVTVREAVRRMSEAGVGSVAVCEGSRLAGIFTERDVLRLAGEHVDLDRVRVADAMTRDVVIVSPDEDIVAAARLMGERRIRHLPVVQGENVLGIVGIRDVLGALAERLWRSHDEAAHETVHELLARPR
ncbi:MAG TPA: CBS domain-containing protein [Gaiellaceae bacterium]|nr:CBS domain-containing protein [Gaiellaceae bacterium]